MIKRQTKALFYFLMAPFLWLSGLLYRRIFFRPIKMVKVHLGPGKRKYFPGWFNVDANFLSAKIDVWADIQNGIPFPDASVDALYSHHMVEHLPDIEFHFSEVFRVLKPYGVFRIGGPNGDMAIQKFVEKDMKWFSDFPVNRKSLGGRFENFIFCKGEHLTILTLSFLEELAKNAGFCEIFPHFPRVKTGFPDIFDSLVLQTEQESDVLFPHTLIIEGRKI